MSQTFSVADVLSALGGTRAPIGVEGGDPRGVMLHATGIEDTYNPNILGATQRVLIAQHPELRAARDEAAQLTTLEQRLGWTASWRETLTRNFPNGVELVKPKHLPDGFTIA